MRRESAPKLSRGQEVQPPIVHRPPWSARSGGTLSLFGGEPVHVDHVHINIFELLFFNLRFGLSPDKNNCQDERKTPFHNQGASSHNSPYPP